MMHEPTCATRFLLETLLPHVQIRRSGVALLAALSVCVSTSAEPRLPGFFGDHMMLQRDKAVPVWGWAEPGETVTVAFADQEKTATADRDGRWRVNLDAMPAESRAQDLRVRSSLVPESLTLHDVLVGDVWLCSGQSNMEWGLARVANAEQETAAADYPLIRHMKVAHVAAEAPQDDVSTLWQACQPETAGGFTAVGFFFARELHGTLHVPIGLINSSWGGTRIEPWTPPEGFAAVPEVAEHMAQQPDPREAYRKRCEEFLEQVQQEVGQHLQMPRSDEELLLDLDASNLEPAENDIVTGLIESLPEPEDILRKQALRIQKWLPVAGSAIDRSEDLPDIQGEWPRGWPIWPIPPGSGAGRPSALYNGMIHPLIPYAIRGAIWYQGESNGGEGMSYFYKKKAMIGAWRELWGQGCFPFYFVQLANYQQPESEPGGGGGWAKIREAQTRCLALEHTGMAVTIDIGEAGNIHPGNKQDVGMRLALWALAAEYGHKGLVHSGPLYRRHSVEGNAMRIDFDHVGSGLMVGQKAGLVPATEDEGDKLSGFAIAGEDGAWHWASAAIDGDTVLVSSAEVREPVAVRYAYTMNPQGCNLYNRQGLPASPFRTDDWD